ncbi:MAG: PRTRC system protein B [Salinisphaeraceae bacterium]
MLKAADLTPESAGILGISPERALIINRVSNGHIQCLVTEHEIHARDGVHRMGAGSPVSPDRLADILRSLMEAGTRKRTARVLPSNVVAYAGDLVAWWVPGRKRGMWFRGDDGEAVVLEVPWPNLLFVAHRNGLHVAGLRGHDRPLADDPVYHAPLMNHDHHQGLCFGSVAVPERPSLDTIPAYENAVFKSFFSHVNGGNHLNWRMGRRIDGQISTEEHFAFWKSLERRRLRQFPERHLLPADESVQGMLDRLSGAGR